MPDLTRPRRTALVLVTAGAAVLGSAVPGAGVVGAPSPPPVPAVGSPAVSVADAVPTAPSARTLAATRGQVLSSRVLRALAGSTATRTGVAVDVSGLGAVLRRNAGVPLVPASTQKSFTVLPLLLTSSPSRRLATEVAAVGAPVRGVQPGALWLVGGGDPFLTSGQLRALARSVRARGIVRVTGPVAVDDSRYDARRRAAGWKPRWVPGTVGPLSALSVNRNRYRADAAFLADPAIGNGALFARYLRAEGVQIGGVRRARRPAAARTVTRRLSAPVGALAARVLKVSDNTGAELLLKELGRTAGGAGSTAAGLAAARRLLTARGVRVGRAADGSGLSSLNRSTAAGQLSLLAAGSRSPVARAFRTSLSVACGDGTLRRRMCGTPAARRVWAKTGTLSRVVTLSGYTYTADGLPVRFSFLLNGVTSSARARAAIDRAVVALASR